MENAKKENMSFPLLDSKLISTTLKELYNIKLIDCGSYIQVYYYKDGKVKTNKKDKLDDLNLKKNNINKMFNDSKKEKKDSKLYEVEERNIIRSKLECQRLAKANMKSWKTFITLTFAENITDVKIANKKFNYFTNKVRRIKKDFKYLCITEFQKRGAIHYHLLTNIDMNDSTLIIAQEDNKNFKHIKYWNDGFTSVEPLENDSKKVIGYIAKYMTKDIDNRLFSHHRYFYSQNLNKPKSSFIDVSKEYDVNFCKKIIQDTSLIYQNEYLNTYDNSKVIYLEYIKNNINT